MSGKEADVKEAGRLTLSQFLEKIPKAVKDYYDDEEMEDDITLLYTDQARQYKILVELTKVSEDEEEQIGTLKRYLRSRKSN